MDLRLIVLATLVTLGSGADVSLILNRLASQLSLGSFVRLDLSNSNNNNNHINSILFRAISCFVLDAYGGRHKVGSSSLIASTTGVDFYTCLFRCVDDVTCQDLDWHTSMTCNTYSATDGSFVDDAAYIYVRKACTTGTLPPPATPAMTLPPTTQTTTPSTTTTTPTTPTSTTPTAPTPATTQAPTVIPPVVPTPSPRPQTPQNPADICTIGYQIIPNQSQSGGTRVAVQTIEQCKMACMVDGTCSGVDYNHDSTVNFNCFMHTQIISTDIMTSTPCCTRIVKVSCRTKQCFSHPVKDLAVLETAGMIDLLLQYITLPSGGLASVPPVQCAGACITQTVVNDNTVPHNPNTIERYCDTTMSPPSEKACDVTTNAQLDVTTTCRCYGDMCNAFGPSVIASCLVYYPFDASADDATPGNRHGLDVNIMYDILNAQKNFSAVFSSNGQSSIKVPSLRSTVLSYPISSGGSTPGVTVAVWIMRTGTTGRQAIINNGPVGGASLDLWTEPSPGSTINYIAKGSVRINNVMYTVESAPDQLTYTNWYFVVLTVTNKPIIVGASSVYYLQLFTLSEMDDVPVPGGVTTASTYTPTTIASTTTNEALDTTSYPVTIGAQPSATPGIIVAGPDINNFIGSMDELYLFRRELNMAELGTVKWISSTMGALLA